MGSPVDSQANGGAHAPSSQVAATDSTPGGRVNPSMQANVTSEACG